MPLDPRANEPLGEVAITRAGPAGLIATVEGVPAVESTPGMITRDSLGMSA
jgi:hypothetical protein